MRDMLTAHYEFTKKLVDALNSAGVLPDPEYTTAVMAMTLPAKGPEDEMPPIGGSLNFDKENMKWYADVDLQTAKRLEA